MERISGIIPKILTPLERGESTDLFPLGERYLEFRMVKSTLILTERELYKVLMENHELYIRAIKRGKVSARHRAEQSRFDNRGLAMSS